MRNDTKGTVISNNLEMCSSAMSKSIGLMFSSSKRLEDNSLIFSFSSARRWSLHMWFVSYPIDVLFLDEMNSVVEIKECFRPFSFYKPQQEAMYIIELRAGAVKDSLTSVGDNIGWS